MRFHPSPDQLRLGEEARRLLRASSPALVRRLADEPGDLGLELEAELRRRGWLGLLVPEEHGGRGGSLLEAAVLLRELGGALAPTPFLSSSVLATSLLAAAGSGRQQRSWLPRLARGEARATVAWLEEEGRVDPAGIALRARRHRGSFRLSGTKLFVLDAASADLLLTAVRTSAGHGAEGVTLLLVPSGTPGVSAARLESYDRTRRIYEVKFDDAIVPRSQILGREGKGWRHLSRLLDVASVAVAAEAQGGAERALELAVERARRARPGGRALASLPAVQRLAAECLAEIAPSRSLLWYAAWAQEHAPREAPRAASMAKAQLADVFATTARRALEIAGGAAALDDELHLWLLRAHASRALFGSPAFHRERVAALSGW